MAVAVTAIQLISPKKVSATVTYDGTAGTGLLGTIAGTVIRAALVALFTRAVADPASCPLYWWYTVGSPLVATQAAGRLRYFGWGTLNVTPGDVGVAALPYVKVEVQGGTASANQNPALDVNANGDDVEVSFLGAVACVARVSLGVELSQEI